MCFKYIKKFFESVKDLIEQLLSLRRLYDEDGVSSLTLYSRKKGR